MKADNQERTQASLEPERNEQAGSLEKISMINRVLIAAVAVLAIVCVLSVINLSWQYKYNKKVLNEKLAFLLEEEEELSKQVSILQEELGAMTEEVDKLKEIVGSGSNLDTEPNVEGERDQVSEREREF